jgi:DNA-binding response OmpR family regulator
MKKNLLIIDDSEEILNFFKVIFPQDQYNTTCVDTGMAAVELCQENLFDVVLIDLVLPDISGYEVLGKLKSNPRMTNAFFMVISSKKEIKDKVMAYNLGAVQYIEKPLDINMTKAIVNGIFDLGERDKKTELTLGDLTIDLSEQTAMVKNRSIRLTGSEFRLLCYLVQREEEVISRDDLLNIVAINHEKVSDRIIDSHMSSLRKKISGSRIKLKSVYGKGYGLWVDEAIHVM